MVLVANQRCRRLTPVTVLLFLGHTKYNKRSWAIDLCLVVRDINKPSLYTSVYNRHTIVADRCDAGTLPIPAVNLAVLPSTGCSL